MFQRKLTRRQILTGAVMASVMIFALLVIFQQSRAGMQTDITWETVYSDTFDTLDTSVWTVSNVFPIDYEWGVVDYPGDSGADSGLWAAGGGALGALQDWETGTYPTEFMATIAIAGPFTPTQSLTGVRLTFDVLNKITDTDDKLTYGISYDGTNFTEEGQVPIDRENWQQIVWIPTTVESQPLWIGLKFVNDGAGVDTGPLVDNLSLEFKYGSVIYLPNVLNQPSPTPSPTPTPLPIYLDDFNDPSSGWNTETALRFNIWPRYPEGRWEEVAYMSYITGHYQQYIPLTWHGNTIGEVDTWFVWPAEKAPLPQEFYMATDKLPDNYCVETRARLVRSEPYDLWWAHWGIVFGANATGTEIYSLQVNANHDFAVLHHKNYLYPGDRQETLDGIVYNIEEPILEWSGNDYGTLIPTLEYNTLKAVVKNEQVFLYINGVRLDVIDPDDDIDVPSAFPLPDMPKAWVGVIGGSWESTPVTIQYDYFKYTTDPTYCPELQ